MNFHYSLTGLPWDDVFDSYFHNMSSASLPDPHRGSALDPAGGLPSPRTPGSALPSLISKPATATVPSAYLRGRLIPDQPRIGGWVQMNRTKNLKSPNLGFLGFFIFWSLAVWDHTVLPSTRHKWTHPALTITRQAAGAGTRFTYRAGMEGWVDLGDLLHTEMVYHFTRP